MQTNTRIRNTRLVNLLLLTRNIAILPNFTAKYFYVNSILVWKYQLEYKPIRKDKVMFNVGDKVTLKNSDIPMTIDQIGTKLGQDGVWFMVSWETQEGDETITNSDWYPEALFLEDGESTDAEVGETQANHGEVVGDSEDREIKSADRGEFATNSTIENTNPAHGEFSDKNPEVEDIKEDDKANDDVNDSDKKAEGQVSKK